MTNRYTAADFANAKFAEHESGQAVALRWTQDYGSDPDDYWVYERPLNNRFSKEATHQEMADMGGWVPVPTKPTLTDSQLEEACGQWYESDDFLMGFMAGYEKAGGAIIDDPEPTNTERLTEMYKDWSCLANPESETFPEYLDRHGVTAPNAKGN